MSVLILDRRRATSSAKDIAELQKYLQSLEISNQDSDILGRLQWLSLIHRALGNSQDAKDAFRNLNGFSYLIDSLTSIAGFYDNARSAEDKRHLFEFMKSLFGVISEALLNHAGNRRYFSKRVGFDTLQQGLAATGMPIAAREELFGLLFRFAMDDATLSTLFTAVKKDLPENTDEAVKAVRDRIGAMFGSKDLLRNPEAIPIILEFQFALPKEPGEVDYVAVAVMSAILSIASVSKANLVAVHGTGVLSMLLPYLWAEGTPKQEKIIMEKLARVLIKLGVNSLSDAAFLYKKATENNDEISEFLLHAIRASRSPAHIQFDTSLHGYSALELASTGRPFPPASSHGFTVVAWVRFDKFDPSMHTTLFGIFDKTQKCFLLAYLERDTHRFILQTSMSGSNASVRFRQKVFKEKTWYHIAIVHRRGKMTLSSAKAALFVNGEFVEEVKCGYPQQPPPNTQCQLFMGIPIALSSRVGKDAVTTKWSLATMHVFEDVVSDDIIAVLYRLGPRYYGNFQDSLGAFQTFEASAALHMRNELMHPGREEKSDIVSVIRNKASTVLPEAKLILSISPQALLDDEIINSADHNPILRGLSKVATKNLHTWTRSGSIILNAAVPLIEEALTVPHGVAILSGTPVVALPQSLDEAAWRIGGCVAVCLKMVDNAQNAKQACRAVKILFETIKESWRNSEAMERENGFGILAHLLRGKDDMGVVGKELLRIILEFVGYNFEAPEESFIVNPLAFRILLVDFELWKKADLECLKDYFAQFVVFAKGSKSHHFNSRKLLKMRVVKKWLFALKSDMFKAEALPYFMEAFRVLVTVNMGAEVMRLLALSITYSLHKDNPSKSLKFKRSTIGLRRDSGTSTPRPNTASELSDAELAEQSKKTGLLVLEIYAQLLCDPASTTHIKKFAKTVTNKWLLYLLAESDPRVVLLGAKILARLLVIHGPAYVQKFSAAPAGGFIILRSRLRRWWGIKELWPVVLSLLFGFDVAKVSDVKSLEGALDVKTAIVYPEAFGILSAMLKSGLTVVASEYETDGDFLQVGNGGRNGNGNGGRSRSKSMSYVPEDKSADEFYVEISAVLKSVIDFLHAANSKCPLVRDFFVSARFCKEIFTCLFPVVSSSDSVSAETELNSKDSALTFDGGDVVIRPLSVGTSSSGSLPVVRTLTVDPDQNSQGVGGTRQKTLRRGSSFILVTSEPPVYAPSSARLAPGILSPPSWKTSFGFDSGNKDEVAEKLTSLIVGVFVDMVLERREFNGYGFFNLVPPGFQEHQAYFDSYILTRVLKTTKDRLCAQLNQLTEPKVLTNIGRFTTHMTDYLYDGLFLSGADHLLDFVGTVLEYLQRPEVARQKTVRLCNNVVGNLRLALSRILIFRLSELEEEGMDVKKVISFLNRLMYWQAVILSPENSDADFMKLICYLLYMKLVDERKAVRLAAANIFRIVLVQKPEETAVLLNSADDNSKDGQLSSGFQKLMEMDDETFIAWAEDNKEDLDAFFYGALGKTWELFVQEENKKTEERSKLRIAKRKETLTGWIQEDTVSEDVYGRHVSATNHWMANIYAEQHLRHQRALQDRVDSTSYVVSMFQKLEEDLKRPGGLFDTGTKTGWKLDLTEGRNRMRKRLLPDAHSHLHNYQPKRRGTGAHLPKERGSPKASGKHALSIEDDEMSIVSGREAQPTPDPGNTARDGADDDLDDFEMVEDPRGEDEDRYEDKNRKVLRSLQHGDSVDDVHNVSRLVGLKAVEGLLILGRNNLYLIDGFFQRSDGEIVNVWQAPPSERDYYLQLISGEKKDEANRSQDEGHDSRHWLWEELISISKRQFLFRDVGLELFFSDGRSYLLTTMSMKDRNALHTKLLSKASSITSGQPSHTEEAWRIEALRSPDSTMLSFGSKIANVFTSTAQNPATKRWLKGELSNFHYLMLVNTMAGRTFNDLTQYPVFPWVLADYHSEELDLTNPTTFRDFSKPMGAQTQERQQEFRDRYKQYEDIADKEVPPFHYGTHYSSAMIVCSYLIRLQPFVQSYLVLQGGNFDHADRLFYSVGRTWNSASRENMTDVRELIPEFFFLPEFLVNSNDYNFGTKQGTDELISDVQLPPWAKGSPQIFIQKHREALECEYVSKHLHEWIDLVFGFKQRGEPAVEATNVFHHLSYRGACDLDAIEDEVQKLATIGIIHNFGQTPGQVFTRPHSMREAMGAGKRLDRKVEGLIRLPFPTVEIKEPVSRIWSARGEKIVAEGPTRAYAPPSYDRYVEWGLSDGSIRVVPGVGGDIKKVGSLFHSASPSTAAKETDSALKPLALFEHPHSTHLTAALFLNPTTLVTASADCVLSIWKLSVGRTPTLSLKTSLFGHVRPITLMAVSSSFSTLLTASPDLSVSLWDLNRFQFVRRLKVDEPILCARINDVSGEIALGTSREVTLYTLNGSLLLRQAVVEPSSEESLTSIAFYEGVGNEWLERELVFTGHRRGVVKVWEKVVEGGAFRLRLVKVLRPGSTGSGVGAQVPAVTAILATAEKVFVGDEGGRVFEWDTQTVERK